MFRRCVPLAVTAVALLLSGCLHGQPSLPADGGDAAPFPLLLRPDGSRVSAAEFRALVPSYDYVLAAEEHTNPCHHQAQAALLAEARAAWRDAARGALHADPSAADPVLALEMLPAEANGALAALDADPRSRADLARNAPWSSLWVESWGYPFELYRPVFLAADAGAAGAALPVRGLNLPRRVVQAVVRGGLEAVAPEDRRLLPTAMPPMPPEQIEALAPYKAAHVELQEAKPGGSTPDAVFGRGGHFELVMRLWDNGMGREATRLRAELGRPVFLLAGWGHTSLNWGIPRAIRHYDATAAVLTITPVPDNVSEAEARSGLLPDQAIQAPARTDIRDQLFLFCPPAPPRARLGFALRPEIDSPGKAEMAAEGVTVDAVTPDGPAARAGLRAGDRLVEADGEPVRAARDVHRAAMSALVRGDDLRLLVLRAEGGRVALTLPLPRPDAGTSPSGALPGAPGRP